MRVCFVNMPVRTSAKPNNVPLGIYQLGALIQARRPRVQVAYCDLNLLRPPPSTEELRGGIVGRVASADLVLLSGLITTLDWQEKVVRLLRAAPTGNAKRKIVSGGGLATNIGETLLDWLPIDAVCVGPGENAILDIVDDAAADTLKRIYAPEPPDDLDALPRIRWAEVRGLERYLGAPIWGAAAKNSSYVPFTMKRSLNLVSSRGCPRECRFCSRDANGGRKYRFRGGDSLAMEVADLSRDLRLDFVGFVDDNMPANWARVHRFCGDVSKFRDWRWGTHSRFDDVADVDRLRRLRQGHCVYLGFGGESGNQEILGKMKKGNDLRQMRNVLGMCRSVGIHPNTTWMMGWPGETRKQVRDTARFILAHAPENLSIFTATAYPGTDLYREVASQIMEQFGDLQSYVRQLGDATKPVLNFSGMSDDEFGEVRELIDRKELDKI